jgi:hypothetical protein
VRSAILGVLEHDLRALQRECLLAMVDQAVADRAAAAGRVDVENVLHGLARAGVVGVRHHEKARIAHQLVVHARDVQPQRVGLLQRAIARVVDLQRDVGIVRDLGVVQARQRIKLFVNLGERLARDRQALRHGDEAVAIGRDDDHVAVSSDGRSARSRR